MDNRIKSADAMPVLESGSKARRAEAGGAATVTMPPAPLNAGKTQRIGNWRSGFCDGEEPPSDHHVRRVQYGGSVPDATVPVLAPFFRANL
jgi:hypothetical protein